MEIDFSTLASRVAAFSDVLGCIILSTDGLVLGCFPPSDEDGPKPAWVKFAALGEPERGFVKFADKEVWAYVQTGPYAAFAVATGATRPGVLLDHMEQTLLVAGESRDQLRVGRPPGRIELVAGARPKALVQWPAPEQPVPEPEPPPAPEPAPAPASAIPDQAGPAPVQPEFEGEDEQPVPEPEPELPEDAEIDPVVLAREFAGLLQEDRRGDEDNR